MLLVHTAKIIYILPELKCVSISFESNFKTKSILEDGVVGWETNLKEYQKTSNLYEICDKGE